MIHVDHLTKQYGAFTAVRDISFHVPPGEVFAFLGPNGSGKTTTLKCMVGLNIPTDGQVLVNGIDVQREPTRARQLISYLPQRVVFPENLTAREIVRFYGSLRSLPPESADACLVAAGFNGTAEKFVGTFSGGMIQRLGLAVTSMADAPVLLLDEPTANLDPEGVKRFRDFVTAQKRAGKTVVFSTHLLAEVEQLADRAAIFVAGKLVALETVEGLRTSFDETGTIEDLYLHYVRGFSHEL